VGLKQRCWLSSAAESWHLHVVCDTPARMAPPLRALAACLALPWLGGAERGEVAGGADRQALQALQVAPGGGLSQLQGQIVPAERRQQNRTPSVLVEKAATSAGTNSSFWLFDWLFGWGKKKETSTKPCSRGKGAEQGPSDFKVMSWNAYMGNTHYGDIAGLISRETGPDVVNLQAAVLGNETRIVEALNRQGNGKWALANPFSTDHFWCGLNVYRSDLWESVWHWEVGTMQDGDMRGICGCLLKRKRDGLKVCAWGAHPVLRNGGNAKWASDLVKKASGFMKECSDKHQAPSVFMCDCNTVDTDSVDQTLQEATGSSWELAFADGFSHIYSTTYPRGLGRTYGGRVAVGGSGSRGCGKNCQHQAWGYSDHPPISVVVDPR